MTAWAAKPLYGWARLWAVLSLLNVALSINSSLPLINSIEAVASNTENGQSSTTSDFITETPYHFTYTPEPRPDLPTSTTKLVEDGLTATGTVWRLDALVSYVLVVHPPSSACQYPQPTGSGPSYAGCCSAGYQRFHSARQYAGYEGPNFTPPSDYHVESSCANGLVYMTPDAAALRVAAATGGVLTERSTVWIFRDLYRVATTDEGGGPATLIYTVSGMRPWDPPSGDPPPYTKFACLPSEGECRSWYKESLSLSSAAATRRLGLMEQIRIAEGDQWPNMCVPWLRSEMNDGQVQSPRTDYEGLTFSKGVQWMSLSCILQGAHVTVYHFAVSQPTATAPPPFCSDGVSKLPFAQQKRAADITSQLDLQPGSALKKARLTFPVTHWGNWSWQDGSWAKSSVSFYDELYAMDAVSDTKKRTGSVTLTTKEMAADKVYLHFDEFTVHRWSELPVVNQDNTFTRFMTLTTSSYMSDIFLEIKTAELSTWNSEYGEAHSVNFKDFEWPYPTMSWAAQCSEKPRAACGTILQDRLYPHVAFPDRLTKEYPDLAGCIFPAQIFAPTDPPVVAPPATDANGQSATALPTLSMPAVVWSQIPQPQAVPQAAEPRATGGTANGDQEGQQNPMGQGDVGGIASGGRVRGEGGVEGGGGTGGGVGVGGGGGMPNAAPGGVTVELGNGARITAAPDSKGKGVLINGMLVTTNGVVTLSDGRKITVDTSGNFVLDGKTVYSGANAASQNSPKDSQTSDSGGDGTQAVGPSLLSETGNSRHKKSQASTLPLMYFGTPFVLLVLIMAL